MSHALLTVVARWGLRALGLYLATSLIALAWAPLLGGAVTQRIEALDRDTQAATERLATIDPAPTAARVDALRAELAQLDEEIEALAREAEQLNDTRHMLQRELAISIERCTIRNEP